MGTPANGQAAGGRARRDLVVIGASTGGVDALQEIVAARGKTATGPRCIDEIYASMILVAPDSATD